MAKVTLNIPEACLEDVIKVIRAGLAQARDEAVGDRIFISYTVRDRLYEWCKEQEQYLDEQKEWRD